MSPATRASPSRATSFASRTACRFSASRSFSRPTVFNYCARDSRNLTENEVVICDQIIRALVRPFHIDDLGIRQHRHALANKALDTVDGGGLPADIRRVVVTDFDARRFPDEHRVAVDANVEIGEYR